MADNADLNLKIKAAIEGMASISQMVDEIEQLGKRSETAEAQAGKLRQETSLLGDAANSANRLLAGVVSAATIKQLIDLSDGYQELTARIKLASGENEDYRDTLNSVEQIATNTRSGLESTGELYTKLAQATKDSNIQQQDLIDLTTLTAQAIKLSGASTEAASGAIQQFGQALGSGVTRGEEFNSLMENAPALMQALADGLGVPIGKLRELAEQGKLTTDVVLKALLSQKDEFAQKFSELPVTVSDAFVQIRNAIQVYVGTAGQEFKTAFSAIGDTLKGAVLTVAGFSEALTVAGQILGTFAGAVASLDFSHFGAQFNTIMAESAARLDKLKAGLFATSAASKTAGDAQNALGKQHSAAAAAAGLQTESLFALQARMTDVQKSAEAYQKVLEAQGKTEEARISLMRTVAQALGDESAQYQLNVQAAKLKQSQAESAAATANIEANALRTVYDALVAETKAGEALAPKKQQQIQAALQAATAKQAEADTSKSLVASANAEVAAAIGIANAHQLVTKDTYDTETAIKNLTYAYDELRRTGASLETLGAVMDALVKTTDRANQSASALRTEHVADSGELNTLQTALTTARDSYEKLATAQQQGKATEQAVKDAIASTIQAYQDYVTALDLVLEKSKQEETLNHDRVSTSNAVYAAQIAQAEAQSALSKSIGDTTGAALQETQAKRLQVEQAQALIPLLQQEIAILQERLKALQDQAAADGLLTTAEQGEIDVLKELILQKKAAITQGQAHVTQLQAEASAVQQAGAAQADYSTKIEITNQAFIDSTNQQAAALTGASDQIEQAFSTIFPLWDRLTESAQTSISETYQALANLASAGRNVSDEMAMLRQQTDDAASAEIALLDRVQALNVIIEHGGYQADAARSQMQQLADTSRDWGEGLTQAGEEAIKLLQDFQDEVKSATDELTDLVMTQRRDLGDQRSYEEYEHQQRLEEIKQLGAAAGENSSLVQEAIRNENALYQEQLASLTEIADQQTEAAQIAVDESIQSLGQTDLSGLTGQLGTVVQLLMQIRDGAAEAKISVEDMASDLASMLNAIAKQQRVTV